MTTMPALQHVALQPDGSSAYDPRIHGEVVAQIAHEHAAYTDARLALVQELRDAAAVEYQAIEDQAEDADQETLARVIPDLLTRAADMLVVRRTLAQWVTGGGHLAMRLVGPGVACNCELGHNHMVDEEVAQ